MAKKILVIDDEADLLMMVVARIKKAGYEVLSAKDGKTGLEMARLENPDLILLDLVMPGIDGYQVCRSLKADSKLKAIPVVIFTASFCATDISQKVKELSADGYISKPFQAKQLIEKIQNILGE